MLFGNIICSVLGQSTKTGLSGHTTPRLVLMWLSESNGPVNPILQPFVTYHLSNTSSRPSVSARDAADTPITHVILGCPTLSRHADTRGKYYPHPRCCPPLQSPSLRPVLYPACCLAPAALTSSVAMLFNLSRRHTTTEVHRN